MPELTRYIKSNPRYTINTNGKVIDTLTRCSVKVDYYNNRSPQVAMVLSTGKRTARAITTLLKENFPERYEIEPANETIYHIEGTIPTTELNLIQVRLRKYFTYNLDTGILYDNFTKDEASYNFDGYKAVNRHDYKCLTHTLIMLYMLGKEFPNSEIDHIDHNRANNKWTNLRIVCRQTNSRNLSMHKSNRSGHTGVNWHTSKNKWRAYIMVNYKQIYLGLFCELEDAIEARRLANIKYKFHSNHGK